MVVVVDDEDISQLEVTAALQAKLGLEGELGLAGGTLRFLSSIVIIFASILILMMKMMISLQIEISSTPQSGECVQWGVMSGLPLV